MCLAGMSVQEATVLPQSETKKKPWIKSLGKIKSWDEKGRKCQNDFLSCGTQDSLSLSVKEVQE